MVIGWDIGGAHLKAARIEAGTVVAAVEIACPLWLGLAHLDAAFTQARQAVGEAPDNAVTMTGELSDIFHTRAEGVATLARHAEAALGSVRIYGGAAGFLTPDEAARRPQSVASANWHATAALAARHRPDALVVDMGSTTTDIVPVSGGRVAARATSDAERLAAGELVYAGLTRSFVMATAKDVPFRGARTPLMNEFFASMADAYRILGELPRQADKHPAADGGEKSVAGSEARLARMIGRDAAEGEDWEWRALAAAFAEAQMRALHDAALQVLSAVRLPDDAPVVTAGIGSAIAARLAGRLGRPSEPWASLMPTRPEAAELTGICAPAVAVGMLVG
jgi:probable H4MPT-linked C1 transfer pathway protein